MSLRKGPRAAPLPLGWLAAAALAGIALQLTGALVLASSPQVDVGSVPPTTTPVASPAGTRSPSSAPPAERGRAFTPLRVEVTGAGIDAPVEPVGVGRDGMLVVPPDVRQVGWWRAGAAPGSSSGTVVLVGHVDSAQQGRGAFFSLRQLGPGDRVVVTGTEGERVVYAVAARRQYPKSSLPRAEVFGQGTAPRLVLLTCGGSFDEATRHYHDNVVVYAAPLTQ